MWLLFLSPKRMRITSPNTHYLSLFLLVCRERAVLSLISPEERGTRRGQDGPQAGSAGGSGRALGTETRGHRGRGAMGLRGSEAGFSGEGSRRAEERR